MSIAGTVRYFLSHQKIDYHVLIHPRVGTPLQTALSANIEPRQLAYAVLLKDKNRHLIAILPSSNTLDIKNLNKQLKRHFIPATLSEERRIFSDCTLGMVPALGEAYGIDAIVDSALDDLPAVYLPSGNNSTLVCVNNENFQLLQLNAIHGMSISRSSHPFPATEISATAEHRPHLHAS